MPATVKQLKYNGSAEVLAKYAENDTKGRKISTQIDTINATIQDLKAVGRFLSVWNAKTGLPETNPPGSAPYSYHYIAGDYFIVGITDDPKDYPEYQTNVSYQVGDQCSYNGDYYICNTATSGTWTSAAWTQHTITNYKPSGTIYTGAASSTVENEPLKANDFYRYDGNGGWILVASTPRTVTFEEIAGNPSDNTALNSALNRKLDRNSQSDLVMQNPGGNGYRSIYFYNGLSSNYLSYIRGSGGTDNTGTGSYLEIVSPSLKIGRSGTARAILATDSLGSDRTYQFPNKNGTFAMTSDIPTVNNPTIILQKNGTTVDSFTLNQSSDKTINYVITKSDVGLSNVDNKSAATLKTEFTGSIESGSTGFALGGDVYTEIQNLSDNALHLTNNNNTLNAYEFPYGYASGDGTISPSGLYLTSSRLERRVANSLQELQIRGKDTWIIADAETYDSTVYDGWIKFVGKGFQFKPDSENAFGDYTGNAGIFYFGTYDSTKDRYLLSDYREYVFPDKSGNVAMTSDIPPITADDYTLEV